MPLDDAHTSGVYCALARGSFLWECAICKLFSKRTQKTRDTPLKLFLLETSIFPSSDPSKKLSCQLVDLRIIYLRNPPLQPVQLALLLSGRWIQVTLAWVLTLRDKLCPPAAEKGSSRPNKGPSGTHTGTSHHAPVLTHSELHVSSRANTSVQKIPGPVSSVPMPSMNCPRFQHSWYQENGMVLVYFTAWYQSNLCYWW